MPSFKTAGKTKDDLVVVAQLAGLLTADEASAMTRTQLIKVLKEAEKTTDSSDQSAQTPTTDQTAESATPPKRKPGRPRSSTRRKSPSASPSDSHDDKTTPADASEAASTSEPAASESSSSSSQTTQRKRKSSTTGRGTGSRKTTSSRTRRSAAEKKHATDASDDQPTGNQPETSGEKTRLSEPADNKIESSETEGTVQTKTDDQPAADSAAPAKRSTRRKPAATKRRNSRTSSAARTEKADSAADEEKNEGAQTTDASSVPAAESSAEEKTDSAEKPSPAQPVKDSVIRFQPQRDPASEESSPEAATAASDQPITVARTDESRSKRSGREPQRNSNDAVRTTGTVQREPRSNNHGQEISRTRRPQVEAGEQQSGVLEIMQDGYGFLRRDNYLQGNKDIYVPPQYIRRFGLRQGDYVTGTVKLQRDTDRYQALLYIKEVNGMSPEKMVRRPHFDRLTPVYPDERLVLESVRNELSTRIIDLVAPIGKGQRGMIVSPPKAGKTILLQKIANAISINNPDAKLIVLLIDERPEEVTDMQRSINGEVVYSTFDKTPENHTKVTELVLERAMRLVELGQDVVILLDSMTRLARAYNLTINPTGRTLSGGLDPGALYGPKRFFGAARNIENGGSLTIIATSLIETGSRMDEVIFEEFKGTGNMEVYLDRKLSEKRIFPAIDINKSGTRREELLLSTKELDAVWTIRKAFSQLDTSAVTEAIINLLLKTQNNEHFISSINVSFNDKNVFEAMRGSRPGQNGSSYKNGYNG